MPATTIGVIPQAPTNFAATESAAGEVDLSWSYDVNIADDFIVTATDADGHQTSHEVDADTLNDAFTGLTPDENYTFTVAADAQLHDGTVGESDPATLTAAASGTNLTATGPTSISEAGTGTLTLGSGSSSTITRWTDNWTDIDGISLKTDTVTGSGGTDSYPTPSFTGLIANITAYDSAGYSFTLPAFIVQILPDHPTGLAAAVISSSEIDLSWTDHSPTAIGDVIYESTDGGTTFYPIDGWNKWDGME